MMVIMRIYNLSLISQLSSTDYIKTIIGQWNVRHVVGNVVVLSAHCEVLKTEGLGTRLACYWVEASQPSVLV